MATFNVYDHIIEPCIVGLQSDSIFEQIRTIYYDFGDDRRMPREVMPGINMFWISPYEDLGRGSGSASLNTRIKIMTFGFGIWHYNAKDGATLARWLWATAQDLEDWFYNHKDFDPAHGISIQDPMVGDNNYVQENSDIVGSILLTVKFQLFSLPRGG